MRVSPGANMSWNWFFSPKARGESLTCDYFGDQQVTISVAGAEKGEAAAQIPQDKLQEGIDTFGEKNEYDMEKGNDDACQQREIQPLASKTALQLKT